MGKCNYFKCPDCEELIKSKRGLINHMIEIHSYKSQVHAIAKLYGSENFYSDHFHCKVCGSIIPDQKVISSVIDKGKTFAPGYCCRSCSKKGFNQIGLSRAHENLMLDIERHKEGKPTKRDRFFTAGKRLWERARKDPDLYNRIAGFRPRKKTQKELIFDRIKTKKRSPKTARLYIVRCEFMYETLVKVGIGNTWRRWKCIQKLMPSLVITDMMESTVPIFNVRIIEKELHRILRRGYRRNCVPHYVGTFIQNGRMFRQSTGFTEWFHPYAFDLALSLARDKYHIEFRSSLEGFNKYRLEDDIHLLGCNHTMFWIPKALPSPDIGVVDEG